ncbi:hypothetical protein B0J18DRAFT_201642 [Chaetomium sp. MPI-SDFR-AT-0129]|nr:hypothetical protein B0J18DRAFT_201642 [Chaetomium sp. MPI-SDFR-AT-0129]
MEQTTAASTEGVSSDGGDDAKSRRSGPAEIRPKTKPVPSKAPEAWRVYVDDHGNECAKPRSRRIDADEFSSHLEASLPPPQLPSGTSSRAPTDSDEEAHVSQGSPAGYETPLFHEPTSTIAGRSGYFKTPSRQASMEARPNLARFLYKGRNPSTHARQAPPYQSGGPNPPQIAKTPAGKKRAEAKSAGGRKKGRATKTRKEESIRARSGFARAVEHFRQKRGEGDRGV